MIPICGDRGLVKLVYNVQRGYRYKFGAEMKIEEDNNL